MLIDIKTDNHGTYVTDVVVRLSLVFACGGGAGIEPVEEKKKIKCCDVDNCECYRSCYYYLLNT